MKILSAAVGVLVLLGLLTWLLVRGTDTNAPAYATALQAFDDLALSEATLHRDVLQARAGLRRDYDSLAFSIRTMQDAVSRLHNYARAERLNTAPADRVAAAVAQQEQLTEQFKTNNALLQNSLSYVGTLSTTPAFSTHVPDLAPLAAKLAAAILHLTRDTSTDAVKKLEERIREFESQTSATAPQPELTRALLAHSRLLQVILPKVDDTLKSLVAASSRPASEEMRAILANHQSSREATARNFRLLLYLISVLLVIMLVNLGVRLRARAVAFRRRATFEHIVAENSTRLINPGASEDRIKTALGEFANSMGARRAYVVLDEKPPRVHAWSEHGAAYPAGWPDQALVVSHLADGGNADVVAVPDTEKLASGPLKDSLTAAGVRSWICVPLLRPGRVRGIMGFDAFQPAADSDLPVSVMRLAGDAVANSLERGLLERDRARLASRLERARRLQSIGSLASGIAHNFNNLIAAILGYSEMIEARLAPGTKQAQQLEEIRRAAERGRELVDNILAFGRQSEMRIRSIKVGALFEETASLLRAVLRSEIDLTIENVADDLIVSGNPSQLQQVILNLCTNAAQSLGRHGSIHVTAKQRHEPALLQLSHGELSPGDYVCLVVTDTGHGFTESIKQRLFEPFFTTRPSGTGLGLATVYEIVREHGGAMHVESSPGDGSRFEAWLPAAPLNNAASEKPAQLLLGQGQTILVVDTEREQLLRDEETLAALGYEPVGFDRTEHALEACRASPDRFDMIFLSQTLQRQEVLDLARALHQIIPQRPVLLATSSLIELDVDALAQAGISEVLRRPVGSSELAAALSRCLHSSAVLQP